MKKFTCLILIFLFTGLSSYSAEYEGVYDKDIMIYSPSNKIWSKSNIYKDGIIFEKHTSGLNKSEYNCGEISLNSDFEFIYKGRLFGADNKNFKFNEIIYEDCRFKEIPLEYRQVQEIFENITVIKLSDFIDGHYTIINNHAEKEIIIFNDTPEDLSNYEISPKEYIINNNNVRKSENLSCENNNLTLNGKHSDFQEENISQSDTVLNNIKSHIIIKKSGRILLYDNKNKKNRRYIIRVR